MSNTCLKCLKDIGNKVICPDCGKTTEGVGLDQTYSLKIQVFGIINAPTHLEPLHGIAAAKNSPTHSEIVRSIVDKNLTDNPDDICSRYKRIQTAEHDNCAFTPNDETIAERIVAPLRHAKASFVVGNFIGCIALCGMVSEMLAVMLFEIFEDDLKGQQFTKKNTTIIGDLAWFESQKAVDRFKCLRDHGILKQDVYDALEHIRDQRNKFLHVYTQDYAKIEQVAERVYEKLVFAVDAILGRDIRDNKFHLAPKLRDWLLRPR